jgi:hypothetical protein
MRDPLQTTRRTFLSQMGLGLGSLALGQLGLAQPGRAAGLAAHGSLGAPHFAPKARRVIYLFQSGGPSQMDLFDYKPLLNERNGEDLPASVRMGQRLTNMSGNQATLPLAGSAFRFNQYGESRAWVSDLLPHTASIADDICFVKSVFTEAINHDPAITFFQTGSQIAGRPCMGSWISYGLGSMNDNLPAFTVLVSKNKGGQPLYSRLWGNGFLPSEHQGVQFRAGKDPILYLSNPDGVSAECRRLVLDRVHELNDLAAEEEADPEIDARTAQYEMAYRMQTSVPEVTDMSDEPDSVFDMYGPDSRDPGSYAANCLLARRLAERDVRFIQLYHKGWDQHGGLPGAIHQQCKETDQATAALVMDLKQRGMLDDTLVIWGGEFGRTAYCQGKLTATNYGRDHHPRCFTMWMAGGGIRPGFTYGQTDDLGYNIAENPLHVHDLHATIMHLLGVDHEQLTHKYQGRRFRLTDVSGTVVRDLLA